MTFNTGNPVGSTDARDLYDNAQNFDLLSAGPEASYPDRLGVPRKSFAGMEQQFLQFLADSGFEMPPLDYVDSSPLQVLRPTQVIQRADQLYRVRLPATFPVPLSGTWSSDELLLTPMSDVAFKQEVQEPEGATLVGFQRAALASAITTAGQMLSAQRVNIWEFAGLVVDKPTPADPNTWDWSPAVQAAFAYLGGAGVLDFNEGTFRVAGVTSSKTISLRGRGAGVTTLINATAGATMFSYDQVGMSDKDRRNWLKIEGMTIRDEASFTGTGIKTNGVLAVIVRDAYLRDFKTGFGLQCLETLWAYLDLVHSDLCEIQFKSTAVPHNNNVVCIRGGELRNPPAGKFGLYVENGDIVRLIDSTIEGTGGGAMTAGGKFKTVKMLSIENTYFEVLSTATEGGLSLEGCQAVNISGSQLNSQSTTVPSVVLNECDNVKIDRCVMVAFPIRTVGYNSVEINGCMMEGPQDISAATALKVRSPMPYNTRSAIVTDPRYQPRNSGLPMPFRNTYADSSFETAAPATTIVAGAPVSSRDTTQGYYDSNSWRVTGVSGDIIRSAALGATSSAGQSGCLSFMAKADTAGRFNLLMFLDGSAGGHDIYLSTEWRRYFVITNLRPASVAGATFLLQLGFTGTNAFNIDDVQFVPFTDYGEIPGIIDGFNYLPTHGATIPGAVSRTMFPEKVWFDRGVNLRALPVYTDNTAAGAGGLVAGDVYRTATGTLMVRY